MAISLLPVNFKDDILASSNPKRKYDLLENQDGSISLDDVTLYSQTGSNFGAGEHNATNAKVNEIATLINNGSVGTGLSYLGSKRILVSDPSISVPYYHSDYRVPLGIDIPNNLPGYEVGKYYLYQLILSFDVVLSGYSDINALNNGYGNIEIGFALASGSDSSIFNQQDHVNMPLLRIGSSFFGSFNVMDICQTAQDMYIKLYQIQNAVPPADVENTTLSQIHITGRVLFYEGCRQG